MPDAYALCDARLIQVRAVWSAANALLCEGETVPNNAIWSILAAWGTCDAAETQDYWFSVKAAAGQYFPVTWPAEFVVNGAINRTVPFVREGMEIKLYPGEALCVHRDAATAGSAIGIYTRFIESDLPLYEYIEPQEQKRIATARTQVIRRVAGGGGGFVPRPPMPPGPRPPRGPGR